MAQDYLTSDQKKIIENAIREAELNTSGEIRVHIEENCKVDVLDRAADIFAMLKMHKTELRNGVLFYLALKNRKFAVIGDAGLNAVVPDNFWEEVKNLMIEHFAKNNLTSGLAKGIELAGQKLKEHFPYQKDDVNELPDEISFGK
jgi:uncharacterized membrane protein